MFTNRYIFIYSSVMVIIVAAILSTAATLLKPFQEKNVRVEKIQNVLTSANITSTKENADDLFKQYIVEEIVLDLDGNVISVFKDGAYEGEEIRAFDLDLKKELKKKESFENDNSLPQPNFPLYVCEKDGQKYYIIPLLGKGLWGPIYGNIALSEDMNTIYGATFGHDKETPGLGAEIDTRDFIDQFIGKTIFDNSGKFVSVKVVKGGIANSSIDPSHGVDAISGGTITSNAVTDMLNNCLSSYVPYIKNK